MQHAATLGNNRLALYHRHLQMDHDYKIWADVLTLEEKIVSSEDILDGQINFSVSSDGPERTASVILSDPERMLSFGTSFTEDDHGVMWVNRLLRIRHQIHVPTIGDVTSTAFIGLPVSASRQGAELQLELGDKSLLADHGVRHKTYKKGANVREAIVGLLRDLTGERHFRIPTTRKKLSRPYTTGMGADVLTPWQLAKKIAREEKGWRLYFSSDGFATAEPMDSHKSLVVIDKILALPSASSSFTDFSNYVRVTSKRKPPPKKQNDEDAKKSSIVSIRYTGIAVLPPNHRLSEQSLNRHGVLRTLPLLVEDNELKNAKAVNDRARNELAKNSSLSQDESIEVIPMFHLDNGDILRLPMGIGDFRFSEGSIPLGTGGNMTLGNVKWVSRPVRVKRVRSKKSVQRKKKKGGRATNG